MVPLTEIDPKYYASGSKSRVANRGDPQLTALQLIIHNLVKIATKRILEILNLHKIITLLLIRVKLWKRAHSKRIFK